MYNELSLYEIWLPLTSLHPCDLEADEDNAQRLSQLRLVGKILSEKIAKKNIAQSIIRRVWFIDEPVRVDQLHPNVFLFCFKSAEDRNRIWRKRPWSLNGAHVVLREWKPDSSFDAIDFHLSTFWVQIHGLPLNPMTRANATKIGGLFPDLLQCEFNSTVTIIRMKYMRIQVEKDRNVEFEHSTGDHSHPATVTKEWVESEPTQTIQEETVVHEEELPDLTTTKNEPIRGQHVAQPCDPSNNPLSHLHSHLSGSAVQNFEFQTEKTVLPLVLTSGSEEIGPFLASMGRFASSRPHPLTLYDPGAKPLGKRKREGLTSQSKFREVKKRPTTKLNSSLTFKALPPSTCPPNTTLDPHHSEPTADHSNPLPVSSESGIPPGLSRLKMKALARRRVKERGLPTYISKRIF
ncbi:hypothetical protein FEM48_Zijuj02G0195800 [Ziziphus jujuba var. spinosa]|uniref:DUF4283 domain-containing protein n=1 Tax=Ziziphus jujuba var. spinosa TaxID=714518 RepID=A0A978VXK4_ZIZJJ|nr:hypothetical protein FEM48_Zijuj02G0195800 [Ziziphus jujuba var. spinosa]